MGTIKVVGREFFGTVNNGHVYMTKQFRELLGLENGDVLLLEIKDFKPSAKNNHLTHIQNVKRKGSELRTTNEHTNGVEHTSSSNIDAEDNESEQPPNSLHTPSIKKIDVDGLKGILQTQRSLQEIADILRIEPYDALVDLDRLVKDGKLLRIGKMYSLKEVIA
ncbi:MAG: hypothetical protein AAE987_02860 [Thermoplasmataceae archaeon]|jgi:bifunctional DNA-binding transcriptional regulator/antitoxin component of YhaV-PrlF toxin-antitoxin module